MSEPGFVVGGRYRNAAGEYELLTLEDGKARIRYASGLEMTLPAGGLWVQWEAMVAEAMPRPAAPPRQSTPRTAAAPRSGSSSARTRAAEPKTAKGKKATGDTAFFIAAGYFAAGCEIHASVAGRDFPSFAQRYQIHTGRSLVAPHAGLEVHERPGYNMRADLTVRFPADASILGHFDLGQKVKVQAEEGGWYKATGTELVERLFRLGFDLGPNTDPLSVRQKVDQDQLGNFDRGMSLRRGVGR